MTEKALSIFIGFVTTLILVAAVIFLSQKQFFNLPQQEVGIVLSAKNSAVLKYNSTKWDHLKKGDLIHYDDNLQGGPKAYLAIQWLNEGETEFKKSFLTRVHRDSKNKLTLSWKKGVPPISSPVEVITTKKWALPSYVEFTPTQPEAAGLTTPKQQKNKKLTNQQITKVIQSDYVRLRACLANNIRQAGVSEGKATMHLNILPTGETKDIYLKDTDFKNRSMNECLLTFFKRLEFPSFEGKPIEINYPVIFE